MLSFTYQMFQVTRALKRSSFLCIIVGYPQHLRKPNFTTFDLSHDLYTPGAEIPKSFRMAQKRCPFSLKPMDPVSETSKKVERKTARAVFSTVFLLINPVHVAALEVHAHICHRFRAVLYYRQATATAAIFSNLTQQPYLLQAHRSP